MYQQIQPTSLRELQNQTDVTIGVTTDVAFGFDLIACCSFGGNLPEDTQSAQVEVGRE